MTFSLGGDGDMLLFRAEAGASRLPKTLGIALVEGPFTVRDVFAVVRELEATGFSNLPVAGLNVWS